MKLVQLLLPLNDNNGNKFAHEIFTDIKEQLTQKYKGVTAFSQTPAEGLWKDKDSADLSKDHVVLYEVMVEEFDREWWSSFTRQLENLLKQEKIMLRWFDVYML